jgi:hypothetical protein
MVEPEPGIEEAKIHRPAAIRIEGRERIAEKATTEEAVRAEGDTLIMELSSEGIFLERKVKRLLQPV